MNSYFEFADIYDSLIHKDIDYAKWSKFILQQCKRYKVKQNKYLDLACGTANLAKEIGPEFHNIWGVDLSQQMLSQAENKLRNQGIKARLLCQDISRLRLQHEFDLITCCLDGTNYILKDNLLENYFQGVSDHLKDDGIFVFDINSSYKLTHILGNNTMTYDEGEIFYVWENVLNGRVVEMYLTFFVKVKEFYRRFNEEHFERIYEDWEIELALKKAGLMVLLKSDSYTEAKINDSTERITYIAGKSKA